MLSSPRHDKLHLGINCWLTWPLLCPIFQDPLLHHAVNRGLDKPLAEWARTTRSEQSPDREGIEQAACDQGASVNVRLSHQYHPGYEQPHVEKVDIHGKSSGMCES